MNIVVALAAFALAATAQAAGLGRLTVLSALGQPLLAEIEIVALQPGEDEGLSARLPSLETFAAAGVDVNPALSGLRISLERRDKRPYLRLTTAQPINEPFLDLLVELSWNSGKLVREYTFLLDPPEFRSRQQPIAQAPQPAAPVEKPAAAAPQPPAPAQPEIKPEPEPAPAAAAPAPATEPQAPAAEKPAAEAQASEAKPAAEKPAPAGPQTYEVKRGDTLGAIAKQHLRPGVTLNQMLIAIFRANEDAFIRGNVNLVRTGKILNIPDPDAVGTVDRDEANRLMKEQYAQFNEYRARLAAVPTTTEAGQQGREVAGSIEKPEAPKPPAPADQLRLSKTEPAKPGAAPSQAAREDDAAARQRALQEAQSRIAELERNVADQQKLLAMRNQQLAELEKKGAAKPAAEAPKPAAEAPKPAAPAPTPAPKPAAEAPKPAAPAPAAPAPAKPAAEAPKPAAEAPKPAAEAPKPAAEAPKPAAKPAPKPAPKPAAKAPPPPEPSIVDEFLDNPLYLGLLAALVLLLIVYGWWTWRRKKKAQAKFQDSVLGAASASSAGAASLTEPTAPPTSGSASVAPSASTAPAGMEAEEVDPIAEADVYMAYGRDAQAEEILKEALQKDSNRAPVHAKLLEIYAHRKDTKAFEQTALKLKNLTGGAGPEWEKAAALGRSIDPSNGLYAGAAVAETPAAAAPAPAPAAAAPTLDFDLGGASQTAAPAPDISLDADAGKGAAPSGLDFDLGATQNLGSTQNLNAGTPAPAAPEETLLSSDKDASGGLDFNLDLGAEDKKQEPAKPAAPTPKAAAPEASGGLDFDFNLDGDKPAADAKPAAPAEPSKVDLSDISLDLGGDATVMAPKPSGDPKWQEVATKLDLAKAYEEMGDKDGARELLKEVVKDGDAAQRGSAEQLLAKLG
ncbi:MAG TPA: FimV/HubP family polar landmark protein [Burkholderiales bacterium]|nr:FimV/HubP family polar landmark protein [Burkholderiales bacterium]